MPGVHDLGQSIIDGYTPYQCVPCKQHWQVPHAALTASDKKRKAESDAPLQRRLRFYQSRNADQWSGAGAMDQVFYKAMDEVVALAKEPYDMGRMVASLDALEHARNLAQDSMELGRMPK